MCVCVYFLRFSVDKVVLSMNRDRLTSTFQSGCLVFFFSWPIALATTSSTVLRRSGENGYPCLISYLRGKACSLSSLSMTLAVGFLHMPLSS